MKRIKNEDISLATTKSKISKIYDIINNFKGLFNKKYCLIFIVFLCILIVIDIIVVSILYKNSQLTFKKEIKTNDNCLIKSNIDLDHEFILMKSVQNQIHNKNLTRIETIAGGYGKIGNALIMLNNLINICEQIFCKNIISPGGLQNIIKKPIVYKDYNITIYPNPYKEKIPIDIMISKRELFWFNFGKKPVFMRYKIIRDEVLSNIPNYIAYQNDLHIKMRSGDVFLNNINRMYSQPPLCFYQKIINTNNFSNIYILSNGRENPVINKLLEIYPRIIYMNVSLEYAISVIINAYNFVMPISTFPETLIHLNTNLKNLYIYELLRYNIERVNYIIHIMKPSPKYSQIMERKWKKTKEQLDLMINENCINITFQTFNPN